MWHTTHTASPKTSPGKHGDAQGPKPKSGTQSAPADELKSLPIAEVQKRLGSSPGGLSQAEAAKRLVQYGPNELEEKKANPLLKLLTYFWGPIPWMIEAAVISRACSSTGPTSSSSSSCCWPTPRSASPRGALKGQGHRRPQSPAGRQGPGETRREVGDPALARAGAGGRHPPAYGGHLSGRLPVAGGRRSTGRPVRTDR